jgi:hypothetical protein
MKNSFIRIQKIAELLFINNDVFFTPFCRYADKFIQKLAKFVPDNDGKTPNPWKRNMDYDVGENSPYFGNVREFQEKFPSIKDWVKWRQKTQKERNLKYASDIREELADLEHKQWMEWAKSIMKSEDISKERAERWKKECFKPYSKLSEEMKDMDREWADKVLKIVNKKEAHYVPEGGDDVAKFEKEQPIYSDRGLEKYKSIEEFLQRADDPSVKAVEDIINYWKLLRKKRNK